MQIPDMRGRTVLVTGASDGLGLASATALARAGARVLMTSRDAEKGERALATVREAVPAAQAEVVPLDLADLGRVAAAADDVRSRADSLDVLLLNAGVMMPPERRETADGFELQLGTNHLGHFALAARLLPLLLPVAGSRVVTVSSLAARAGAVDLADLQWQSRPYDRQPAYGASKLANLLFAFELERRLRAAGTGTASLAAHPGVSGTNLMSTMQLPRVAERVSKLLLAGPDQSARPQLYAATATAASGGEYYGPKGPGEVRGRTVALATVPPAARDRATAEALWTRSEELTGTRFDLG
ncbi:oxidoreductase [Jannaschia sp. R86511]|uniref:oxidoreductase n=1 Tax=Jannaschia sp. R86511 TaxID=3093853 RepID=UPI0036D25FBE